MCQSKASDFTSGDTGTFESAEGLMHGGTGGDDIIYYNEGIIGWKQNSREALGVIRYSVKRREPPGSFVVINTESIYQIF